MASIIETLIFGALLATVVGGLVAAFYRGRSDASDLGDVARQQLLDVQERLMAALKADHARELAFHEREIDAIRLRLDESTSMNKMYAEQIADLTKRTDLSPVVDRQAELVDVMREILAAQQNRHEEFAQNTKAIALLLQGVTNQLQGQARVLNEIATRLEVRRTNGVGGDQADDSVDVEPR